MKSEFEKILKSKLFEAETPAGYQPDWEGFVAFREKAVRRRRKRNLLIFSRSVAALFIITVSIIGLTRINYNNKINDGTLMNRSAAKLKDNLPQNSVTLSEIPNTEPDAPTNEELIAETTVDINKTAIYMTKDFSNNVLDTVKSNFESESPATETERIAHETGYSLGKLYLDKFSVKRKDQETGPVNDTLYDIEDYLRAFDNINLNEENNGWSTSFFANALSMNGNQGGDMSVLTGIDGIPVLSAEKLTSIGTYSNSVAENKSALIPYGTGYYKDYLSHQLPIILSASVSYGIFPRVDISSGLVYSFLHSEFNEYSTFNNYSQKLHYIGIPVSVSYDFLPEKSSYTFYSVGGILFEKAVSAIGVTKVFEGPVLELNEKISLNTPKIMLSGNMGFGIGYDIIGDLGIYLEPYLSYNFYTKGQPVSYKTANDFSFNIKVGFKYKF